MMDFVDDPQACVCVCVCVCVFVFFAAQDTAILVGQSIG